VTSKIPKHVAIIMDGNGRWAERRGRPRVYGHIRGSARVKPVIQEASRQGVKALTFYAFSTENWGRPENERRVLWKLLKKYLLRDAEELHRENIRLRVIGEIGRLDADVREVLEPTVEKLSKNTGLILTFALSYGSRREMTMAAQQFAEDCMAGRCQPQLMSEELFENYLWTADLKNLSNVDLFIRTSGEKRVSNFLLWQSAYAEFVFVDVCWPDFEKANFAKALEEYALRDRRYGGVSSTEVRLNHL
jgi:undecaprenyl diphosphate synthase